MRIKRIMMMLLKIVQIYQGLRKKMKISWITKNLPQTMKDMNLGTKIRTLMKIQIIASLEIKSFTNRRVVMTFFKSRTCLIKMKMRHLRKRSKGNSKKSGQRRPKIYFHANTASMNWKSHSLPKNSRMREIGSPNIRLYKKFSLTLSKSSSEESNSTVETP